MYTVHYPTYPTCKNIQYSTLKQNFYSFTFNFYSVKINLARSLEQCVNLYILIA